MASLFIPSISQIGSSASKGASFGREGLESTVSGQGHLSNGEGLDKSEFAQKLMSLLGVNTDIEETTFGKNEIDLLSSLKTKGEQEGHLKNMQIVSSEVDLINDNLNEKLVRGLKLGISSEDLGTDSSSSLEGRKLSEQDILNFSEKLNSPLESVSKELKLLNEKVSGKSRIGEFLEKSEEGLKNHSTDGDIKSSKESNKINNFLNKINSSGKSNVSSRAAFSDDFTGQDLSFQNKNIKGINNYRKISGNTESILNFAVDGLEKNSDQNFGQNNNQHLGHNFRVPESTNNTLNINALKIANAEALDLSSIPMKDTASIVNEVTNYIEKNRLENTNELSLTVKHEELGHFKVDVSKLSKNQKIDMKLSTTTPEGSDFFKANESNLIKSLTDKGIQISSLKVTSLTDEFLKSDLDNGSFKQGPEQFSKQQRQFGQNQNDQGRQKRQQLWQAYQEQIGA